MGTLIAKLAEGIPVALSTPATRLDYGNRDVTVDTPSGRITARAAIITVSTNVLASGNIKFATEIPKRVVDAAQNSASAATITSRCNCPAIRSGLPATTS